MESAKKNRGCLPHLFFFLIFIIVLLFIAKFTFRGLPEPQIFPTPTQSFPVETTLTPASTINLLFSPSSLTTSPKQRFKAQLSIDPNGTQVSAVDLFFKYDNDKIFLQATPSGYFQNEATFASVIDNEHGTMHIALGGLYPTTSQGTLITFSGYTLVTATGAASLSILPDSKFTVGGVAQILPKTLPLSISIISSASGQLR